MLDPIRLRHFLRRGALSSADGLGGVSPILSAFVRQKLRFFATESSEGPNWTEKNGKCFTLPPYTDAVNGAVLGKDIARRRSRTKDDEAVNTTTALKWVQQCCPDLPRSLVQKLFRLRKVRRESLIEEGSENGDGLQLRRLRRVAAKDTLEFGDRVILPSSVQVSLSPAEKEQSSCSEEEVKFMHSLVVYKDPAIVVINKPPGMPVQGGINIKRSLDEIAASSLNFDFSEPPRLVHRLDRDCSGILLMGRTQTSASVLHSIFREKTFGASKDEVDSEKRTFQKHYWALVIGSPRRLKGLISAPLGKMVMDNGRFERTMIVEKDQSVSFQHAITAYRVIKSFHGYSWLELTPLTGRKHQLRVHCAEALGTPIVGDYKYGWQAHRNWKSLSGSTLDMNFDVPEQDIIPFGLNFRNGSITEKKPRLHLHCKQIILPNISLALEKYPFPLDYDLSNLESLELDAPLPLYMQRSWDMVNP